MPIRSGSQFLALRGHEVLGLEDAEREFAELEVFKYWRGRGFPVNVPTLEARDRAFRLLSRVDGDSLPHVLEKPSMVGLSFANSFHPAMWSARRRGASPFDCYCDDECLARIIKRLPNLFRARRCWAAAQMRQALSLNNASRVSNFRPSVARALMHRYSQPKGRILDFSAGYGGRLLAALSLPRHYIGIDPAGPQVHGLRQMIAECQSISLGSAQILKGGAEKVLPLLKCGSFDLVITSPPYFKKERYTTEPTQSYIKFSAYSDWVIGFLRQSIEISFQKLKIGGHLVINISNIDGYNIADDAMFIGSKTFGGIENVWNMHLSRNPSKKTSGIGAHRSEPIFVFRKARAS